MIEPEHVYKDTSEPNGQWFINKYFEFDLNSVIQKNGGLTRFYDHHNKKLAGKKVIRF